MTAPSFQEPKSAPAYGSQDASVAAIPAYNPPSASTTAASSKASSAYGSSKAHSSAHVAHHAPPVHMAGPAIPGAPFVGFGILSQFCQHRIPLALRVVEAGRGSASLDDFDVTDAVTGQLVFRFDASLWQRNKKRMYDAYGKEILILRPDVGWFKSFRVEDPAIVRDVAWFKGGFGSKSSVKFGNRAGDGRLTEVKLRGQTGRWRDPVVDIMTLDGTILANIQRQRTDLLSSMMRLHEYILTVQPGVDAAFMVALCVCADEMYER